MGVSSGSAASWQQTSKQSRSNAERWVQCARRSFADLLCLGSGLWLDLSSRDDRGGDGNEPRALGLGVLGDPETSFDELVSLCLEGGRGAANAVAGLQGFVREKEGHRVTFGKGLVTGRAVGGRPRSDFEARE